MNAKHVDLVGKTSLLGCVLALSSIQSTSCTREHDMLGGKAGEKKNTNTKLENIQTVIPAG